MGGIPFEVDDLFADSTRPKKRTPATDEPFDVGSLFTADSLAGRSTPAPAPVVAPPPKPGNGRGIAGDIREFLNQGGVGAVARAMPGTAGDIARGVHSFYENPETRTPLAPIDRRTPEQQDADQMRTVRAGTVARPDVTDAAGVARMHGPSVAQPTQTVAEDRARRSSLAMRKQGIEASEFSPEHWKKVAQKGMEYANTLHGEGRHQEAEDVLRKAYNAQLLAQNSESADTFGAIALSNLLGIVSDPHARERQNIAEINQPGMTFTPEEQTGELGIDRGAATARGFDATKDLAAPLVGQLPVIVAGGAVGRGIAGVAGAAAERAGLPSIGRAIGRLATPFEEATALGPSAPMSTVPLARARIADEIAALRANLPTMMARGATEGQTVGAIQSYRMAREQGATVDQALSAMAEGVALSVPIGVVGEVGVGSIGRALGAGFDPVGRNLKILGDHIRGISEPSEVGRPRIRLNDVDPERARPAKMSELGGALDQFLGRRTNERGAELNDIFGTQDTRPADADWWNAIPPEEIPRAEAGAAPLGPEAREPGMIESAGFRSRSPVEDNPVLPTAREAGLQRAGVEPRPHEEANAFMRMQRAQEEARVINERVTAEANDPNLVLERAAQERPGEVQGPVPLADAIAKATDDVKAEEPMAVEYRAAIDKYADALAATKDLGEGKQPNTRQQIALARARQALNAAREKYGAQIGMSAVAALAASDEDLTDDERSMAGLAGVMALSTKAIGSGEVREPLHSRLRAAVDDPKLFPKKWDEARPVEDWIGKLKGSNQFSKKELATVLPSLERIARGESQITGTKITRAQVQEIVENNVPRIERTTLGEKTTVQRREERGLVGDEGDPNDIVDPDIVLDDEHYVDYPRDRRIMDQLANRQARIAEIDAARDERVADAERVMNQASDAQGRAIRELHSTLEKHGLRRTAADEALDYINENSSGEEFWGSLDKAMEKIQDELLERHVDYDELLDTAGYTVDEIEGGGSMEVTWHDDEGEHVETFDIDSAESMEEALGDLMRKGTVDENATAKRVDDGEPYYRVKDNNGSVRAEGDDRNYAMQEAVSEDSLDSDSMDELYGEIKSDLDSYIDKTMEYGRAESEHYHLTEGDEYGGMGEEEFQERERLEDDEIPRLRAALDEMADNGLAGTARQGIEAATGEAEPPMPREDRALPPGEPVAVVDAPDADIEEIIAPTIKGAAKYSSYQRIGGGKNYRELLNQLERPVGYKRNHYGTQGFSDVVGHIRAEDHAVATVPGITGEKVEISGDEPQVTRDTKSKIVENRRARDRNLEQMTKIARDYEALPAPEREGATAMEMAENYKRLNQQNIDLSKREDELVEGLRTDLRHLGEKVPEPETWTVMIENQSDLAQDAGTQGIEGAMSDADRKEVVKRLKEERDPLRDRRTTGEPPLTEAEQQRYDDLVSAIDEIESGGVPATPFVEGGTKFNQRNLRFDTDGRASYRLGAARFLIDAAERGYDNIAWSDAANRVKNAHLPIPAARLVYDDITTSAIKTFLQGLGFKVEPKKVYIRGEGHWGVNLTPEMRKAIKRIGLPLLGVMAFSTEAQAQGEGASTGGLYGSALGGVIAGGALMYLASSRKARRLVKENRELARALMVDDLSGLANKRAFTRALRSVDLDESHAWATFDGNKFKKVNDVHGHSTGDKAIQHFGQVIRDVAESMNLPMRGFRSGGDEFSFAVPKDKAAEFVRRVEQASPKKFGEIETSLTGAHGETHDIADALLNQIKEENRAADPSLRRDDPARRRGDGDGGFKLHSNPIGPALRELARFPSAAALAGLGVVLSESDDPDLRDTGKPVMALAALSAIGSRRIAAGADRLGKVLFDALSRSEEGTAVARAFNPDALLHPDVREAIKVYEGERSRAGAKAAELARGAQKLGPEGDRAVSDVLEGEQWEDTSNMSAADLQAVLTFAAGLDAEYQAAAKEMLATGARQPEELLEGYAGKRVYAYHEAQAAQTEGGPASAGGTPRIKSSKHRTLDEPVRIAQANLDEATAAGDPQAIQSAQDALDEAEAVRMSRRVELGEIRESSYRAAISIERAYADAAAAKLFKSIRDIPGAVHPEWAAAVDDLKAAKAMRASAKTQADRDAAKALVDDATVRINDVTRQFERADGEYVSLPGGRGLGELAGGVVKRDVAHTLTGFSRKNLYTRMLRAWKEVKTVFNPGTHQGNILSNIGFAHMEGLHLWEQPAYLKRAAMDMKKYGPATKALAEAGILDVNAVNAPESGVAARDLNRREGLESMLETTRPETADVLRREGISETNRDRRIRRSKIKGAAGGALLGAAKMYDEENPQDAAYGAAVGAGIGALVSGRRAGKVRTLYNNEDNIFRAAIWLRKVKSGMTPEQATEYTRNALGNFRSRSPALHVLRSTVAPFILYPAKALPRFGAQVVDHPWRYMALVALWGGLNEYSQQEVGEANEHDIPLRDRREVGYILPGFTQLPFGNARGEKAAVDVSRWTPLSAATTAAPPGSVPASFDEETPDIFRAGGPVVDLASRFGVNVDPFSGKPFLPRDYPPGENAERLVNSIAGTMLPSALDFHVDRVKTDIENQDWDKAKNDLLGPTGLRPRFIRPGSVTMDARFQLTNSLREMKQAYRRDVINNKNPQRNTIIFDRYLRRVKQALQNFRERTGLEPSTEDVRDALDAGRSE